MGKGVTSETNSVSGTPRLGAERELTPEPEPEPVKVEEKKEVEEDDDVASDWDKVEEKNEEDDEDAKSDWDASSGDEKKVKAEKKEVKVDNKVEVKGLFFEVNVERVG